MKVYILKTITLSLIFFSCTQCSFKADSSLSPALSKISTLFYTENNTEKVIQSVDSLYNTKLSDDEKYLCALFKAAALCEAEKINQAIAIFKQITPQPNNSYLNFWYNSIKGLMLFRQENYNQAYEVLVGTTAFRNPEISALALNERLLARISLALDDYDKGLNWLFISTHHFEKAGFTKSMAINYKLLGRHYMSVQNHHEALKYFKKAENILLKTNDPKELFYIYANLVDYYLQTKQPAKAKIYAERYFPKFEYIYDNQMRTLVYNNLGEIEVLLKNYNQAAMFFSKTLEVPADYSSGISRRIHSWLNLSSINRITGNKKQALSDVLNAKTLMHVHMPFELKSRIYNELALTYHALDLNALSYLYLDSAKMQSDSINLSVSKATKAFYDSKMKLAALSTNLEQTKIKENKSKVVFTLIIVGLCISMLYLVIIFRLQRSKTYVLKALVEKNLQLIEDDEKLNEALHLQFSTKKLTRKSTDEEKNLLLYNELIVWLMEEKQFQRKDLTADIVARELGTNREYLSRAVSSQQLHFNELINKYRIEEAVKILSSTCDKRNKYNLNIIASDVGFKSMSVFIEAFRKQTGMNPAQFRSTACSNQKDENG